MRTRSYLGSLLFGLVACSSNPELVPGPGAMMPGPPNTAYSENAGVQLEINTDAWNGIPQDLGDDYTPVLATVTNESNRQLRIRYSDFVLIGPSGEVYHALPPFYVTDTVTEPLDAYVDYHGFRVAPYLSPYYPRLGVYSDPFFFDHMYWNSYYPAWVEIRMPTQDMIEKALPEGVLEPGGRMTGFLYFEDPDDDVGRVDLNHTLTTPTGVEFGRIEIPLITKD